MPKSRTRKRGNDGNSGNSGRSNTGGGATTRGQSVAQPSTSTVAAQRPPIAAAATRPRSLLWPALVALGCWGMAVSFFFYSNDPNHMLFGALVVVMALLWTFSLGVRWRKLKAQRPR